MGTRPIRMMLAFLAFVLLAVAGYWGWQWNAAGDTQRAASAARERRVCLDHVRAFFSPEEVSKPPRERIDRCLDLGYLTLSDIDAISGRPPPAGDG